MNRFLAYISKVLKPEFVKNTFTLMTGTSLAQIINFLLAPFLTRLYTPADFGMLATFMAITNIIGIISNLRYEMAILLPKREKDSISIIAISLLINFVFVLLTAIAVVLFIRITSGNFLPNKVLSIYYLLPFSILLIGAIQVFNFWSLRLKTFKQNALARIGNSAGNIGIALILGLFFNAGGIGLILAYIGALIINLSFLLIHPLRKMKRYKLLLNKNLMISNAKKNKRFPIINTPHTLIGAVKDNGIIFIIKDLFGQSILGSYSFSFRILNIPTSIISSSISQVFYQNATQLKHQNQSLKPLLISIYKTSIIIGFPIFLILFIIAPDLFALVFSENYRLSGEIARYIIPWIFINFVASSVSSLPLIYNKLLVPMLFTIGDIILQLIAITIGWYFDSFALGFILIGILCFLNTLGSFVWIFVIVNKANNEIYE